MSTHEAEDIIAFHTGGRESWDHHALRQIAEYAMDGREPLTSYAPDNVTGLFRAFSEIQQQTKPEP